MILTVISGGSYTVVQKWQNSTKGLNQEFDHPYFQSFVVVIGEALALPLYYLKRYLQNRKKDRDGMNAVKDKMEVDIGTLDNTEIFSV